MVLLIVKGIDIIAPEVTPSIITLVVLDKTVALNNSLPVVAVKLTTVPLTDSEVAIVLNSLRSAVVTVVVPPVEVKLCLNLLSKIVNIYSSDPYKLLPLKLKVVGDIVAEPP